MTLLNHCRWTGWTCCLALLTAAVQATPVGAALQRPAVLAKAAARSMLQSAAKSGNRLVAVGERGIVVLSDDQGQTWRQVPVPVSVGLTAVHFIDAQHGWIAGHGGVVLATSDGGQSWNKQLDGLQVAELVLRDAQAAGDTKAIAEGERLVADGADKPFLDIRFDDTQHGLVVGAYNLALTTADGGKTWQPISRRLDNPRGLHLYSARARGNELVISGEQGLVLRSTDHGASFQRLVTPYKGSFFTAALPGAKDIVLAGLRGNVWRSGDGGTTWKQLAMPEPVSVTASALDDQGRLWLTNQAGVVLGLIGDALVPVVTALPPLNGLLPLEGDHALALSLTGAVPLNLKMQQGLPK
jgi:photosystem II stability/assembly factor-like uncharacterized protein